MFYNGIISSQEVFQIDLVRKRFHFSSSEMRWESSLWCEPSQSSGNHRSEKLRACWTDTHGPPIPTHPQVPFAPSLAMCSILVSQAVPSLGRALPISMRGKTFLKKIPLFPQENPFILGDLTLSQHRFPCVPGWHPAPGARWPFHCSSEGSTGSSKALERIWWEGEKGFYKLPFKNGHFEVM